MSRGRIAFFLLSLALTVPLLSTGVRRAAAVGEGEDSLYKQLSIFSEVLHLVRRAYVDEVSTEDLLSGALDGAADALDPLSTFVPAEELERYVAVRAIGAGRSGLTLVKERGITLVVAVVHGSPGAGAGLRSRDVLVEIDGQPTRRMPLWKVQSILAGDPGTRLEIELLRRGQPETAEIVLEAFARSPVEVEERGGESVIRVYDCDPAAAGELETALEEIARQGRDRVLVDLRGVAVGDGTEAYRMGRLFAGGKLGVLTARGGEVATFSGGEQPLWNGSVVALIDRGTMGCGEILAAILKEGSGAHLVGQPSFGHAGRLALLPLSSGARLLTTDAFYTGPEGRPLSSSILPDTRVSEFSRSFGEGERSLEDVTLERGLEVLRSLESEPLRKVA